jgi:hypothetical protein
MAVEDTTGMINTYDTSRERKYSDVGPCPIRVSVEQPELRGNKNKNNMSRMSGTVGLCYNSNKHTNSRRYIGGQGVCFLQKKNEKKRREKGRSRRSKGKRRLVDTD